MNTQPGLPEREQSLPELVVENIAEGPTTEQARIERHNGQIARAEGNVALNDATPDTPFIASNAMAAAIYEQDEQRKRKERDSFILGAAKLRKLIAKLEQQRDQLLDEIEALRERAQSAFDLADDMEDILEDITEEIAENRAMSDATREKALDALRRAGIDTEDLTDAQIIALITEQIRAQRAAGSDLTDQADIKQDELDTVLEDLDNAYALSAELAHEADEFSIDERPELREELLSVRQAALRLEREASVAELQLSFAEGESLIGSQYETQIDENIETPEQETNLLMNAGLF